MAIESDLSKVVVPDKKEDAILNVSEDGRAGGMEEQLCPREITSTKVLHVRHFYCPMLVMH